MAPVHRPLLLRHHRSHIPLLLQLLSFRRIQPCSPMIFSLPSSQRWSHLLWAPRPRLRFCTLRRVALTGCVSLRPNCCKYGVQARPDDALKPHPLRLALATATLEKDIATFR